MDSTQGRVSLLELVLEAENLRAAAEAVLAIEASDPDRPALGVAALLTDEDAV